MCITEEIRQSNISNLLLHEAYKVNVTSSAAEGDFMTYKATVVEVLKNTDRGEWQKKWNVVSKAELWAVAPSSF